MQNTQTDQNININCKDLFIRQIAQQRMDDINRQQHDLVIQMHQEIILKFSENMDSFVTLSILNLLKCQLKDD